MADERLNLLQDLHRQAGAEFQSYAEIEIPSTFGNTPAEYSALHKSCGLMDLPQRTVLEASGKDRLDFLNRLLSNQTYDKQKKTGLPPGRGVYSFLLNNKGRIIADMTVLELGERTWLEMDFRMIEPVRKALDAFLFGEDVKLSSLAGSLHEITLQGPKSAETLAEFAGSALPSLQLMESAQLGLFGQTAVVYRNDLAGASGFGIILPADGAAKVWSELTAPRGEKPGLRQVGWAAFNAVRIEAGKPMFGIDFDSPSRARGFLQQGMLRRPGNRRPHALPRAGRPPTRRHPHGDRCPAHRRRNHSGRPGQRRRRGDQQHHLANPLERGDLPGICEEAFRGAGNGADDSGRRGDEEGQSDGAAVCLKTLGAGTRGGLRENLEMGRPFDSLRAGPSTCSGQGDKR